MESTQGTQNRQGAGHGLEGLDLRLGEGSVVDPRFLIQGIQGTDRCGRRPSAGPEEDFSVARRPTRCVPVV